MDDFGVEIKIMFLAEAKELLLNAEQCFLNLEKAKDDPDIIDQLFRLAHNLKGSAGAVGFNDLKDFTHGLESLLLKIKHKDLHITAPIIDLLLECNDFLTQVLDVLKDNPDAKHDNPVLMAQIQEYLAGKKSTAPEALSEPIDEVPMEPPSNAVPVEKVTAIAAAPSSTPKKAPVADESIRVSLSKVEQLLNSMGELVILQTVIDQQKHHAQSMLMQKTIGQMSKIIKEAQSLSMSLRMVPLKQTFQKMQRIVRDTSNALDKEIEFSFSGEDTELDKTVIEQLSDPLVHLIRNAVDHGVESPEDRRTAGKSVVGRVHLSAAQRGGQIIVEIQDDGKGLDPAKLIKKAKEKGLLQEDAVIDDESAYKLIFAPGFSTKEQVTDVSGRGVGMDVVKNNISLLHGDVEVNTVLGQGTCFRVLLPLTMAIIDSLVVSSEEERYVVPISQVYESLRPKAEDLSTINGVGEVLCLRGQPMPLYRLDRLLKRSMTKSLAAEQGIALVCMDENQKNFAVLVNDIINQQQVVIKNLGQEIKGIPGITGAAILGDGRTSLILDLFELTQPIRKPNSKNNSQHNLRGIA